MAEDRSVHEAFTALAPRYEQVIDHELRTFWGWSYDQVISLLLERAPLKPDQKLLDIATGTAVIPRRLAARGFQENQLIGLDITEAMLHRGKEEIQAMPGDHRIRLTCGDALQLLGGHLQPRA